ncbi:MAG: hypothetical protein WAW75_11010 [Gallionella sp.]
MTSKLPINLADLLRQRTLCAFSNDFENLGDGYIVIGQDCDANGQPVFPPIGLPDNQLDKIQRELLGYCNLIQPPLLTLIHSQRRLAK